MDTIKDAIEFFLVVYWGTVSATIPELKDTNAERYSDVYYTTHKKGVVITSKDGSEYSILIEKTR